MVSGQGVFILFAWQTVLGDAHLQVSLVGGCHVRFDEGVVLWVWVGR
jgi:hypothetical protein